jgi:hypothetical protein
LRFDPQKGPRLGQFNPPTGPYEKWASEFLLKGAYLHAQRRLHDVKPLRRTSEVPLFGNGQEIAKMAKVHIESYRSLKLIDHSDQYI